MTITEKVKEARKNLPKNRSYARYILAALKEDGINVTAHRIYRVGAGLKREEDFSEADLWVAKKIIELAIKFQEAKKNI